MHVTAGSNVTLKVFMQNNFPYKLFNVSMRGSAANYTITVAPPSQHVGPGQKVLFTYTIKAPSTADIQVSTLALQVKFRLGDYRGASDPLVNQNPSQSLLLSGAGAYGGPADQAPSLWAARLADKYPAATLPASSPTFGRTGLQQLIKWFGYRFCFNSGGGWRCGANDCPSAACAEGSPWTDIEQFPQVCMRAGVELGARKAKLGSLLTAAQNGAVNAMKAGGAQHRCLAAVVGGLLWKGVPATAFESALNALPATCKAAGLRALGKGTASTCSGGTWHEQASCAGAEGLAGNDAVVTSVLIPNAGDGQSSASSSWQKSLFYSYMLYLVTMDRYNNNQQPSWYGQVGPAPDAGPPPIKKDTGGTPAADRPPPQLNEAGQVIPGPEAGQPPASDGAQPGNEGAGEDLDGGCGCQLPARPSAPVLLGLLLPALLLLRRRSRRPLR